MSVVAGIVANTGHLVVPAAVPTQLPGELIIVYAPAILLLSTDDEGEYHPIEMLSTRDGAIGGVSQAQKESLVRVGLV